MILLVNTLVLTELMSLLFKSEDNVIAGLKIAKEILPFNILGLDTDNVLNLKSMFFYKK